MIVNSVNGRVEKFGISSHNEFRIKASSKAFELLVGGLYSNPIRAFIRELSTNAYEAHQEFGVCELPFEVSLPTTKHLDFTIRDYGPGLSPESICEVYTVIFNSTKDTNNDFAGGLGLGCKSPFAYSANSPFAVTSIYDRVKYYYTCYRNESGIPCMDLVHSENTDEPSGVEITVSIKKFDVELVHHEAEEVYSAFDTKPNIVRSTRALNYKNYDKNVLMSGPDFKVYSDSFSYVKMGNIIYPIDYSLVKHHPPCNGLLIYAPIGSVMPDAGRERLSYDGQTVGYLNDKLSEISDYVAKNISKEIDKCECYYDAVDKAIGMTNSIGNLQLEHLTYRGEQINNNRVKLEHSSFYPIRGTTVKYGSTRDFYHLGYGNIRLFCVDSSAHKARIKQAIKSQDSFVLTCTKDKLTDAAKELRIPESRFELTSKINYVSPSKGRPKVGPAGHKTKVLKWKYSDSCISSWDDCEIDIFNTSGLYVEYYANKVKFNDIVLEPKELRSILTVLGLPYDTVVYGIKSELLRRVENKMPKLKNLCNELCVWVQNSKVYLEECAELYNCCKNNNFETFKILVEIVSKHNIPAPKELSEVSNKLKGVDKARSLYDRKIIGVISKLTKVDLYTIGATKNSLSKEIDRYTKRFSLISDADYDNRKELKYYILGKGF